MKKHALLLSATLTAALLAAHATAAVSPEEANALKNNLTPLGAEKAGNSDGSIPAWTGGLTGEVPGARFGDVPADPFPGEKPLFRIDAKNAAQYGDKLPEGTKALLAKYPDSFFLDVYPSHRTAAAP